MADTAVNTRATFQRPDTLFGICEAIGQDFGFNPLWLRLAIVPAIFFAPVATLFAYLIAGLFVLASRLLFPTKDTSAIAVVAVCDAPVPVAQAVPAIARNDVDTPMALAA